MGRSLRGYEFTNLIFFLLVIIVLSFFVTRVFHTYRTPRDPVVSESGDPGIQLERITPEGYSCVYYVGTRLTEGSRICRNPLDIPPADDGFMKGLMEIDGVVEVLVDRRMIIVTKSPAADWGGIQSRARQIITAHLHPHP